MPGAPSPACAAGTGCSPWWMSPACCCARCGGFLTAASRAREKIHDPIYSPRKYAMNQALDAALNRLTKWRSVFCGWQLGTRSSTDPEAQAVRDHREATML